MSEQNETKTATKQIELTELEASLLDYAARALTSPTRQKPVLRTILQRKFDLPLTPFLINVANSLGEKLKSVTRT